MGRLTEEITYFKTSAWKSKQAADAYQHSTLAAPSIFQIIRNDLYLRYVTSYAEPGAKILDLGCGTGLITIALHRLGFRVTGCDASQPMLDYLARELEPELIDLRCGDGFGIPAADGEFDMVISRMFMQHFPDWHLVLKEKARVTRPRGIVLFDFGNAEHIETHTDRVHDEFPYSSDICQIGKYYAVASREEMQLRAEECGLEVLGVFPFGFLLYNVHVWNAGGRHGVDELNAQLNILLQDEKARELMLLIEQSVLPRLPVDTSYGNVVVLRRK